MALTVTVESLRVALGLPAATTAVTESAAAAGNVLAWITRKVIGRAMARTRVSWDDNLISRLGGPLSLLWAVDAQTARR